MPKYLRLFIADVLEGKRKRPAPRGPDPYAKWERDYCLCRTTQLVAKVCNLPHYSHNGADMSTAAGIVSQATGIPIEIVIRAYRKFRKLCRPRPLPEVRFDPPLKNDSKTGAE